MGEWKEVTIDQIKADSPNALATGPFGSAISSKFFTDKGVPVIRGGNLSANISNRLSEAGLVFISTNKAEEFKRSEVRKGDLVFTCWGTINQVGLIDGKGSYPTYIISNKQMKLTPHQEKADSFFLYYFFSSPQIQEQILSSNIGSSVPGFNLGQLKTIELNLPPLPEQKAIASVLSRLDDKIDLLHRQNKTLEAMAETLFRQWFVEEAQEGWEDVELEYVTERITDGAHQSPPDTEIGMPMASVKDMHEWGIDFSTCRKISEDDYQKLVRDDCRPLKNDILIAKDGSYLKHIFVVPDDMDLVILSSIAIIRPNGKFHPILLSILLKMDSTKELLKNIVTGAVIPRIVLKDFRKFQIILPPFSEQNKALISIEPLINKCYQNMKQIRTLEKLRDTLLPKLMSGEVRVEYDAN